MKIVLDRFPCHLVAAAPGKFDDVEQLKSYPPSKDAFYEEITRVVITDEVAVVAKDSQDGPKIIFREAYDTFIQSEKPDEDSYVVTKSGKMLAFKKDRGCGCGSRLRGWNAYSTISSIKD